MKKSQILALLILLATGHGIHAAWIGYNNPFDEQIFADNDLIQFRHDSILDTLQSINDPSKHGNNGGSFQQAINQKNKIGRAFLLRAVQEDNVPEQKIKNLIEFGADINQQDCTDETSLHIAVEDSKKEIIQLILAAGADVNRNDKYGYTPLHLAAMLYRNEATQLLLDADADVNRKNNLGNTPLHLVILQGPLYFHHQYNNFQSLHKMIQLLLMAGTDITIKNNDGRTARELITDQITRAIFDEVAGRPADQTNNCCSIS